MARIRFLITQNPNKVLDPDHRTRLPRIVGWNLVKLAYQEFLKKYNINVFEDFECLDGVNPLLFSQLCIYYYADVVPAVVNEIQDEDGLIYTEEITKNKKGNVIDLKKCQHFVNSEDEPAHTCKNLPSDVGVNCSYVTPKGGQVAVILINTISRNI